MWWWMETMLGYPPPHLWDVVLVASSARRAGTVCCYSRMKVVGSPAFHTIIPGFVLITVTAKRSVAMPGPNGQCELDWADQACMNVRHDQICQTAWATCVKASPGRGGLCDVAVCGSLCRVLFSSPMLKPWQWLCLHAHTCFWKHFMLPVVSFEVFTLLFT